MRFSITLFLCLLFINSNGQSLSDYKWKNRLIVFTGDISEENSQITNTYKEMIPELKERKLVFLQITEKTVSEMIPHVRRLSVNTKSYDFLKEDHPNASVFLIGLDGGIKRATNILFKPEELFQIIDAMPMRASEIRRKNE